MADTAPWTFLLIVYPTLCGWYSTLNFSVNCVPYTLWLIHLEPWTFLLIVYPTLCGWYSTLDHSVNCVHYTLRLIQYLGLFCYLCTLHSVVDTAPWTFLLIVYPTLCGWYSTLNFSVNCVHSVVWYSTLNVSVNCVPYTLWLIQHLELFC